MKPVLPEIKEIKECTLVGLSGRMSLSNDKTGDLWRRFRSIWKEVDAEAHEFFNVTFYDDDTDFRTFDGSTPFTRWAGCKKNHDTSFSNELEQVVIPAGLYAVFEYTGPASAAPQFFAYILGQWLPQSAYEWDQRPQFEILGRDYKPMDADSNEQIWIPIKTRLK